MSLPSLRRESVTVTGTENGSAASAGSVGSVGNAGERLIETEIEIVVALFLGVLRF